MQINEFDCKEDKLVGGQLVLCSSASRPRPLQPSSCETHPALTTICFSSSPPSTNHPALLPLVCACLVLSPGLNHASEMETASRPGSVLKSRGPDLSVTSMSIIRVLLQIPDWRVCMGGAMFLGFWAVALMEW